jgi:hypothetical protein
LSSSGKQSNSFSRHRSDDRFQRFGSARQRYGGRAQASLSGAANNALMTSIAHDFDSGRFKKCCKYITAVC